MNIHNLVGENSKTIMTSTTQILLIINEKSDTDKILKAYEAYHEPVNLIVSSDLNQAKIKLEKFTPDLIITDGISPDENGFGLHSSDGHETACPVLILTPTYEMLTSLEQKRVEGVEFISKTDTSLNSLPYIADNVILRWNYSAALSRVEEALYQSEAQKQALLDTRAEMIFRVNQEGIFLDFIPTKVSAAFLPPYEIVGKQVDEVLPVDFAQKMMGSIEKTLETGTSQIFEYELVQQDKSSTFESRLVASGDEQVICIVRDISNLKEIENKLLQRNRELMLLNRAGQALSSTLDLDQVLVIMLEEVRRLLNVVACSVWLIDTTSGDLVCRQVTDPLGEIVRGWRLAPGQGLAGWVANRGEGVIVADAWDDPRHFKGIDEQTGLPLRSILTVPLRTKQDVIGVLQVVDQTINRFDSTDLRLMESLAAVAANAIENAHLFAQLTNTQEQLIHRERLAALGQMAATVAHELRNPLMAIRMGVEYLLRNVSENDPRQRGAKLMDANMDRIDRIVEDILFVARAPQPKLAPALLHPIIKAEIARWELSLSEKQIILHENLDEGTPPIQLDTHQIARALSNLIGNSLDALPPGGQMHLTLESKDEETVTVTLVDNGPGISPENLSQVFEPFFTTKTRGTGLGLSIVKQIIDYHRGDIEVWSQIGVGTRFTITLPVLGKV